MPIAMIAPTTIDMMIVIIRLLIPSEHSVTSRYIYKIVLQEKTNQNTNNLCVQSYIKVSGSGWYISGN